LPNRSRAATLNSCGPLARPAGVWEPFPEQATAVEPTQHSKVLGSLLPNTKVGVVSSVLGPGPASRVVSGAIPSASSAPMSIAFACTRASPSKSSGDIDAYASPALIVGDPGA
jgi:hypothetical protein